MTNTTCPLVCCAGTPTFPQVCTRPSRYKVAPAASGGAAGKGGGVDSSLPPVPLGMKAPPPGGRPPYGQQQPQGYGYGAANANASSPKQDYGYGAAIPPAPPQQGYAYPAQGYTPAAGGSPPPAANYGYQQGMS